MQMKYELCYLVGESREQDIQKIKEEVEKIVSQEGGSFLEPQIEERRKMAYKVGKEIRGIYVAQRVEISSSGDENEEDSEKKNPIDNITRKLNLSKDVLRFIFVKAEDLPELKAKEAKEEVKKESKKVVFAKSEEKLVKKEEKKNKEVKEEKKIEEPKGKKEEEKVPAPVEADSKEQTKESKSIDEKIDEILNI